MSQHAQDKRRQAVAEKFQQDFFTTDNTHMEAAFSRMNGSPNEHVSRMLDGFGLTGLIDCGGGPLDCRPETSSRVSMEMQSAEPAGLCQAPVLEEVQEETSAGADDRQGPESCEWFAQLLQRAAEVAELQNDIASAAA